jgi:hypothetical protein
MRAWVYKVNAHRPGPLTGWHFDEYFRYRGRPNFDMGGQGWIRSGSSWAHLRRVRAGDAFICYQSDERRIYGLSRAATDGYPSVAGSDIFDSVDFVPRGLRLRNPVSVREPTARHIFQHIRAFAPPSQGTVHALAKDELLAVLRQLAVANPSQEKAIFSYAKA